MNKVWLFGKIVIVSEIKKTTNFGDKRFLFCISGIFIVKNANWVIILKYIIIN